MMCCGNAASIAAPRSIRDSFNVHLFTQSSMELEERDYGTSKAVRSPYQILGPGDFRASSSVLGLDVFFVSGVRGAGRTRI